MYKVSNFQNLYLILLFVVKTTVIFSTVFSKYAWCTHEMYTFYCDIVLELRDRNKNYTPLSTVYEQVFVTSVFPLFIEGTMRGPEGIMFALSFSPHVVKQLESNCSCCSSCHPSKYQESSSQGWHIHSIPKGENGQMIEPPL